jgi:hypothetical protein
MKIFASPSLLNAQAAKADEMIIITPLPARGWEEVLVTLEPVRTYISM